jgi:hypothetical protein
VSRVIENHGSFENSTVKAKEARRQLVELLDGRPSWRLEPQTTPGAPPLWCFVVDGEIEYSVAAADGTIHLYVMATDQELAFRDADALTAWLQTHRSEALQERPVRPEGKERARRFFEWG